MNILEKQLAASIALANLIGATSNALPFLADLHAELNAAALVRPEMKPEADRTLEILLTYSAALKLAKQPHAKRAELRRVK